MEQQPAQPSKEEVKAFIGGFFSKPPKSKSLTAEKENNGSKGSENQNSSK